MIKPESYNLIKGVPSAIVGVSEQFITTKLERAAHGAWFLNATISAEFIMRDGRKVVITKVVRLKGSQEGKRPNPNPFGRNNKKERAKK